jgi:hypothetical protein
LVAVATLPAPPTRARPLVSRLDRPGLSGRVIRVTTLRASGPGSLREALQQRGPRLVVFEVGGVIDLERSILRITSPFVTVAGQTAPSPGITLIRGGLRISTHDVHVAHLRIRPGDADLPPGSRWEPDGVSIQGPDADRVVIDHCSISWGIDENVGISGWGRDSPRTDLLISNNLISEALHRSLHSKGPHSMGLLVNENVRGVRILNNIFAHNNRRNPRIQAGAEALIAGNLIYNPGRSLISVGLDSQQRDGTLAVAPEVPPLSDASVIGNLVIQGPDSQSDLPLIDGVGSVFQRDNVNRTAQGALGPILRPGFLYESRLSLWCSWTSPRPPCTQPEALTSTAGARPWDRDAIDRRVLSDIANGGGAVVDSQNQVGGYPSHPPTHRPLAVPAAGRARWLKRFEAAEDPSGG